MIISGTVLNVVLRNTEIYHISVADLREEPGPPGAPLFWVKKEEITDGRIAGGASKAKRGLYTP